MFHNQNSDSMADLEAIESYRVQKFYKFLSENPPPKDFFFGYQGKHSHAEVTDVTERHICIEEYRVLFHDFLKNNPPPPHFFFGYKNQP